MTAETPAIGETQQVALGVPDAPIAAVRAPRSGLRNLARAATGGFGLNVINTAATVLTTVVLARTMELGAFGTYSWVVATVYLLSVPALLGLDRLLIRDVAVYLAREAPQHARGLMRRSAQVVAVSSLVIVSLVALVALVVVSPTDATTSTALVIGVLALPALALAWLAQSALIGMHKVVLGQVPELALRPVLLLALIAVVALVAGPIQAPTAALLFTVSAFVTAAFGFAILRLRSTTSIRRAAPAYDLRRWLMAGVGLSVLSGAQFANSQIGVVALGVLDDADAAGLFAVAQRGALLVAFPLLALNAALAPTAARLWSRGETAQLQRLVTASARGVLLAALPIAIGFVMIGGSILALVFGNDFTAASPALAILSLAQIANVATGSVALLLMMTGHQTRAGIGILFGLGVNLGLCVILVPSMHAEGAALAAAAGIVVANLIHVAIARSTLRIDPTALGLLAPRPR
jgi:O-antigen/teichoic acid export membrane protein